jgi:hypothetical protein
MKIVVLILKNSLIIGLIYRKIPYVISLIHQTVDLFFCAIIYIFQFKNKIMFTGRI